MSQVSRAARKAENSDALDHVIRVGLVAYGVVHILVGWLAVQVAFGEKSKSASSSGAMQTLAQQPLGEVLVWIVAIGMAALVLWRLLEAWQAFRTRDGADAAKKAVPQLFKAVLYGALAVSAFGTATGSSGGGQGGKGGGGGGSGGSSTDSMTADLMAMTGGQLIVGAIGLGILGYGAYYVYQGWTGKYFEKLDGAPKSSEASTVYRVAGKWGHIAKGIAIGTIGVLFTYAAMTHDASKSGGLDQALQELAQQPFGQVLLTLVGVGIALYGVFAFIRARHFTR